MRKVQRVKEVAVEDGKRRRECYYSSDRDWAKDGVLSMHGWHGRMDEVKKKGKVL